MGTGVCLGKTAKGPAPLQKGKKTVAPESWKYNHWETETQEWEKKEGTESWGGF